MRLTDLAPKWIGAEGRSGIGVSFGHWHGFITDGEVR